LDIWHNWLYSFVFAVFLAWVLFFSPLSDYDLATSDFKAYQELMDKRQKEQADLKNKLQKQKEEATAKKYNFYKYKCPMCGSNKIVNISQMKKTVSTEAFGLGSKKLGKCYQCDDCKYMW